MLLFKYGNEGVIGFTYQGVGEYYYKKNILGDILAIINQDGTEIVKYVYDAWGNHKTYVLNNSSYVDINENSSYTENGLNNKTIAELNPFRYRSYYYDIETNLFYLNSRYYDPELGRFINADDISILDKTKEFINGLNLYIYCSNNPIMNTDETGYIDWGKLFGWIVSGIAFVVGIAMVASGFASIIGGALISSSVGSIINGYISESSGGSFTAGWIGGAISGFICGLGAGTGGWLINQAVKVGGLLGFGIVSGSMGISFLGGSVGNFLGTIITSSLNGTSFDISKTIEDSILLGVLNIIASFGSSFASTIFEVGNRVLTTIITMVTEGCFDLFSYLYQINRSLIWGKNN